MKRLGNVQCYLGEDKAVVRCHMCWGTSTYPHDALKITQVEKAQKGKWEVLLRAIGHMKLP